MRSIESNSWLGVIAWAAVAVAALTGSLYLDGQWSDGIDAGDIVRLGLGVSVVLAILLLARPWMRPVQDAVPRQRPVMNPPPPGGELPRSLRLQRQATLQLCCALVLACLAVGIAIRSLDGVKAAELGAAAALTICALLFLLISIGTSREASGAGLVEAAAVRRKRVGLPLPGSSPLALTIHHRPLPAADRAVLERTLTAAIADALAELETGSHYGLNEPTLLSVEFGPPSVEARAADHARPTGETT